MTGDEFEHLLAWLHPDPDAAAHIYQQIHQRLVSYFRQQSCAHAAVEDLADATIDRVAAAIREDGIQRQENVLPYFLRFARYVRFEHFRKQKNFVAQELDAEWPETATAGETNKKEVTSRCFNQCLSEQPADRRQIFIRYYGVNKQTKRREREALAAEFGYSVNALRLLILRLRRELDACIEHCQAGQETE